MTAREFFADADRPCRPAYEWALLLEICLLPSGLRSSVRNIQSHLRRSSPCSKLNWIVCWSWNHSFVWVDIVAIVHSFLFGFTWLAAPFLINPVALRRCCSAASLFVVTCLRKKKKKIARCGNAWSQEEQEGDGSGKRKREGCACTNSSYYEHAFSSGRKMCSSLPHSKHRSTFRTTAFFQRSKLSRDKFISGENPLPIHIQSTCQRWITSIAIRST